MPKISVIIPVYNVEKYLDRCLTSLINQTFTDFEVLLVDDGSTDGSGAICDAWAEKDSRVRVFHQENAGAAAARNVAIDWAVGESASEWICFVDSDDYVSRFYLEKLYMANLNNDTDVCCCNFVSVGNEPVDDDGTNSFDVRIMSFAEYYADFSLPRASMCNKLCNKSLFEGVRYPIGKVIDDVYIMYKLLYKADKISVTDEVLYYYYIRENSTMHSKYSLKMLDGLDACKEQLAFFEEKNDSVNAQTAFTQLIRSYGEHCTLLLQEDGFEYEEKLRELIQELRVLLKKKKYKINIKEDATPLEFAWPKRMWLYWTVKGITAKFKK